jgi:hypothetical protein
LRFTYLQIEIACSQIEVHVFTDWGSRIHGMRFTCSQIEVHVLTDWGSRIYRLRFTYSLIEVHVFTDWGSGFRSNYKWFVYSQIEVHVFTDWSSCIHWLRFVYSLIYCGSYIHWLRFVSSLIKGRVVTVWGRCRLSLRTVSSQIEGGVVTDWGDTRTLLAQKRGSRMGKKGRGGSRKASESTLARAITVIALCALLYLYVYPPRCSSTLVGPPQPSSTHTSHGWTAVDEDGEKQISLSLVDVLKISSTESRFFSLTNVFSMDFAHGHCAFDKHIRLSGHTEMILWCLI